jgi:geranylgeranylglycerol-phosphate geranylgeranyltransferase
MRPDPAIGAGIFIVAGDLSGPEGIPSPDQALSGFLTGFFISGSANISSDYFDRDADGINQPNGPLCTARISVALPVSRTGCNCCWMKHDQLIDSKKVPF